MGNRTRDLPACSEVPQPTTKKNHLAVLLLPRIDGRADGQRFKWALYVN